MGAIWAFIVELAKIAPILLAFGSITAAVYAVRAFQNGRVQNRRDTTISLITRMTSDGHVTDMLERFRQLRYRAEELQIEVKTWDQLRRLSPGVGGWTQKGDRVVKDLYNFYEVLALGVEEKWLDEQLIKGFWRGSYVLDWLDFQDAVYDFREKEPVPEAFEKLEKLAYSWAKDEKEKQRFILHKLT